MSSVPQSPSVSYLILPKVHSKPPLHLILRKERSVQPHFVHDEGGGPGPPSRVDTVPCLWFKAVERRCGGTMWVLAWWEVGGEP